MVIDWLVVLLGVVVVIIFDRGGRRNKRDKQTVQDYYHDRTLSFHFQLNQWPSLPPPPEQLVLLHSAHTPHCTLLT